ncbi:MAG: multiple sugar transport system substrate-binding protein [Chloroflexota bacterium]|jgi:multiple sugar transport system substrate-binding protein|nr:multiple sugar transport system substrate-binding protein [Chloroflexota bacterium]
MSEDDILTRYLTRRDLLRLGVAVGGVAAAGAILAACGPAAATATPATSAAPTAAGGSPAASAAGASPSAAAQAGGKLVIGAFEDGALTPFKATILPMFEAATGTKVEFLTEPYDSFFAKAFQDGQSKAGQYDIYIMDDPWIPQYAAAGILEDLGPHGITMDADYPGPFADLGFWPPRTGARVKGFETQDPKLIALPTIGDLQTLTYRNDVFAAAPATWDDLVSQGKAGVAAGKVKYGFVFRGVKGNPIVTSFYPIFRSFGADFFDDKWAVTFNSDKGKAAADFFVGTLKSIAPKGVAEFDSDQEGAAILGGDAAAIIQYSGNAIKSDDPAQSKVVGKLDFGVVPKQESAIAQIGIFIHGVSASAPNKDNAIAFMKWFATNDVQTALARSGDLPVKTPAFSDAQAVKDHRLLPVALAQLNAGAQARPRMPDWSKVESIIGTELNTALAAGSGGGAALDRAATQVTAYLTSAGYY